MGERALRWREITASCLVVGGVLFFITQLDEVVGFPLMGDVSGEDDGSRLFGGFVLGINLIAAYAALFAHRSVLILPALYSFTGIIFWGGYSVEHLGRWMAGGGGNPLLLVPEAMSVASVGSVVALAGAMITIHSAEARRPRRNAARWG